MNYRDHKIFVREHCYHIFNRGVGKMNIFRGNEDKNFFLYRMKEYLYPEKKLSLESPEGSLQGRAHTPYVRKTLPAKAFTLLSYCLMPNHFHFLIRQNTDLPISKLLAKICTSYSKYFNKKYDRVGGLFQDCFKAVLVDNDSYLLWLSAYIHQNPKVAGLVKNLQDYTYSSYLDYSNKRAGTLVDKDIILDVGNFSGRQYEKFVLKSFDKIKERKDFNLFLLD